MKKQTLTLTKLLTCVVGVFISSNVLAAEILLQDNFTYPDGLITNEYAFWNPNDTTAIRSPIWDSDSGSFFASGGAGWTGVPNNIGPNRLSTNGNNSSVFRLNTKRTDFENVSVEFDLLNQGLNTSPTTPAVSWDGLHIWLRYQSEYYLYYASINRRDNTVVIKKKIPGGPSNGGTYYELTKYVPHAVPYGTWHHVRATALTNPDGSVTISLYDGGTLLVRATDDGTIAGPPIKGPGRVGIRGDNANLKFDNFLVTKLDPTGTTVPPTAPIGVTSIAGDKQFATSWSPVPTAVSYNMYRSTNPVPTKANSTCLTNVQSPYISQSMTNGTVYYVRVTALNSAGEGAMSSAVSCMPKGVEPIPAIPTGLVVAPGDSQILLSWPAVKGAVSYNIYRSRFPGITTTTGYKIANAASPYLNTGLTNGTPIYFRVSAVNATGESDLSVEVSAKPGIPTVTKPPTGVVIVPGNTTAKITWNAVPGATSYNLYRSRAQGVTKENGYKIANVTNPYLNTGFTNGTMYYMVVTAVNSVGESAISQEVSVKPQSWYAYDPRLITFSVMGAADNNVTAAAADFGSLVVSPVPWRQDRHGSLPVTFANLTSDTTIKIFTTAGQLVTTLMGNNSATWNLKADSGDNVASGLYTYLITNGNGEKKRGLLAVIR